MESAWLSPLTVESMMLSPSVSLVSWEKMEFVKPTLIPEEEAHLKKTAFRLWGVRKEVLF